MSVENTNTPNGDSSKIELYKINPDNKIISTAIADVNELNPELDLTGNFPGDNTVVGNYITLENSIDLGSVKIGATLVGQPMRPGVENAGAIKASVEEVKKMIIAKGALTAEAYIEAKKSGKLNARDSENRENEEQEQK